MKFTPNVALETLNRNPSFLQMRKWAPRDHLTSYLRHSAKTKPVTCNTSFASHFLSRKCPNFKLFPNYFVNQTTLNNETYDVTDDGVIELTTTLCKKPLRILTGYICSKIET